MASQIHNGLSLADSRAAALSNLFGGEGVRSLQLAVLLAGETGEQLGGLGAVLEAGFHAWAPRPLLRSIFEWCADAFWLSDDSYERAQEGAHLLASRFLLYQAISVGEQGRLAQRANERQGWLAEWPARQRHIDERIRQAGLAEVDRSSSRPDRWSLGRVSMPTRTERIERFLDRFFPENPNQVPWYKWWSMLAHPSATAAQTLTPPTAPGGGSQVAMPREPMGLIVDWIRDSLVAWALTTDHVLAAFGWAYEPFMAWLAHLSDELGLRTNAGPDSR